MDKPDAFGFTKLFYAHLGVIAVLWTDVEYCLNAIILATGSFRFTTGMMVLSNVGFRTTTDYLHIYLSGLKVTNPSLHVELKEIVDEAIRLHPVRNRFVHGHWHKGDGNHGGTLWTVRFRGRFGLTSEKVVLDQLSQTVRQFGDLRNRLWGYRRKTGVDKYLRRSLEAESPIPDTASSGSRRETQSRNPKKKDRPSRRSKPPA